ncbi:hypothetical protein FRC12_021759 [Ceratobasidium sp. 428]|nr:hypothetical protein FRC12_021759 [Ceratobasidium sp. 428]
MRQSVFVLVYERARVIAAVGQPHGLGGLGWPGKTRSTGSASLRPVWQALLMAAVCICASGTGALIEPSRRQPDSAGGGWKGQSGYRRDNWAGLGGLRRTDFAHKEKAQSTR